MEAARPTGLAARDCGLVLPGEQPLQVLGGNEGPGLLADVGLGKPEQRAAGAVVGKRRSKQKPLWTVPIAQSFNHPLHKHVGRVHMQIRICVHQRPQVPIEAVRPLVDRHHQQFRIIFQQLL